MRASHIVAVSAAIAAWALVMAVPTVANGVASVSATTTMGSECAVLQTPVNGDVPGLTGNPLTLQQRQQIINIRRQERQQVSALCADRTLSSQERSVRISQIRQDTHQRIMNVLTEQQRTQFQNWWAARYGGTPVATGAELGAGPAVTAAPCPGFPGLIQNPLTAEQSQQICNIQQQTRQQLASIRSNTSLTTDQRNAMMQQVIQSERDQVVRVLTADQVAELNNYWQMGSAPAGAGAGPDPSSMLGLRQYPLTADQEQCVARIQMQTAQRIAQIQANTALTDQQKADMIARAQFSERQQILSTLTPQQRQEFETYWQIVPSTGAGAGAGPMTTPSTSPGATSGSDMDMDSDKVQPPATDVGPGVM